MPRRIPDYPDAAPTTPTAPTTPDSDNKPLQNNSLLLLIIAYFNLSPDFSVILLPFDQILTKTDPFFFNVCLAYLNVCEFCILSAGFLLFFSLIGLLMYLYSTIFPSLKSYLSKKENSFWNFCLFLLIVLIIRSVVFSLYGYRFYLLTFSFIEFLSSDHISYYFYNPPGLAMGNSRVLHLTDYSPIFTYLNMEYINPENILHVFTIIKYIAMFTVAFAVYFIIATITTIVYRQDKFALSLPNGPASLNLFTKIFFIKSQQTRIILVISFFAIVSILMALTSFVLYHYIAIYKLG